MKSKQLYFISALIGVLLGGLSARVIFVGSWLSLIPWAIAGIFLGWLAMTKRTAVMAGAWYGFLLPVAFMFIGHQGAFKGDQMMSFNLFALLLGVIGIGGGIILTLLGYSFLRKGQ